MCKYEGCKVPAGPADQGLDWCILHAKSPKDIGTFMRVLYKQIDQTGDEETRNPPFHFIGYRFPCAVSVGKKDKRAGGWGVVLPKEIEKDARFDGAEFGGVAFFSGVKFKGKASFYGATFLETVTFHNATFEKTSPADSSDDASREEMDSITSLYHTLFGELVSFARATFKDTASFSDATFEEAVTFTDATFRTSALFSGATFKKGAWFFRCSAESLFLGGEKPHIRGWGQSRCGVSLRNAYSALEFWRFAQRTFASGGEREKADCAFYFERLWRWRALRPIGASIFQRVAYCFLWCMDCVFLRWTTAYGISLARLFITWSFVIASFGIAFSWAPSLMGRENVAVWTLRNWIDGFHFSVTNFATLGLGDFIPWRALGKVLTSIEALLGAVLVALAVLVIGRKFMRQS